jgi:dihydrofolate reductase
MRKPLVRYYVAVSVDGFIAPPDGSVDWFEQAREGHGQVGKTDDGYTGFEKGIGGLILGRQTFETELGFGPWGYEAIPAVVMTNRAPAVTPKNVHMARGDPSAPLAALKARVQHGDIWLLDGGVLEGQLLDAGLIDRVEITVLPISLGQGRPLFGEAERRCVFDRVETRTHGGSKVAHHPGRNAWAGGDPVVAGGPQGVIRQPKTPS